MNYHSYIFLVIILLGQNTPVQSAWRLGTARKVTPTIQGVNTYTLTPIKHTPEPMRKWDIRQCTTALQKHKNISLTQLVVHEKTQRETKSLKCIKGYSSILAGIPELSDEYITIACRGFALRKNPKNGLPQQGGGLVDGYSRLRNDICYTPLVTFDFPDERRTFNFGQELDQTCLKTVYSQVIAKNPNAKIILTGDCRGALTVLKFAATNPKNLYALVLTSPFVSAKEVTNELAKNYLQRYIGKGSKKLLHNFFQWWFPNFDPAQDNLWHYIDQIKNKKIIIIHRSADTMVADKTMHSLVKKLKENNATYLSIIKDTSAPHAKLVTVNECQQVINAFYKKYLIPYNIELAYLGQKNLTLAKELVDSDNL